MLKFVTVGAGSFIEMNGRPRLGLSYPTIFSYPVLSKMFITGSDPFS